MSILIHITDQKNKAAILRAGIKLGKKSKLIYFMPLSSNYNISHQWARELKRGGIKNFAAVSFRLPDEQMVWYGKYNDNHQEMPLGKAIGLFLKLKDQNGFEFFIEQKIDKKNIIKVYNMDKPIGWRYFPESHGRKPCFCPGCSLKGEYGSSKPKKQWDLDNEKQKLSIAEARKIIEQSNDVNELCDTLWSFMGKSRKADPTFLFRLFEFNDDYLEYQTIKVIGTFKHPLTKKFLKSYSSNDADNLELVSELIKKRGY